MKMLTKSALFCSISVLLAACGDSRQTDATKPVLASTVMQKSSAAVAAPPAAYNELVQRIYVGYFGRPADPGGLAYFSGLMSSYGLPTTVGELSAAYDGNPSLRSIVEVFSNSQESKDFYAGDNSVFMDAVYRNLFGRAPDADGKAYWVNLLNSGAITRVNAALQIMAGALGTDVLAVNKRVVVATMYTNSVNTQPRLLATEGNDASIAARNLLATLDLGSDVNAYQPKIDTVLADLVAKAPPAGIYSGKITTANGGAYDMLVLDDGSYWGFYSSYVVGMYPAGVLQGKGTWSQGAFNSTDVKNFATVPAEAGNIGAAYVAQTTFNGNIGVPNGTVPFSSSVIATPLYNYLSPANLGEIAGSWNLFEGGSGYMYNVTVAADGKISGVATGAGTGCNFSGTLTPRASRKNVFDAAITYSAGTVTANACHLSGQSATGVAFTYAPDATFPRRLFLAATNAARTAGSVYHTGLVIQDTQIGTGTAAVAGKAVSMNYTGYLYNGANANPRGTQFDTSTGRGAFAFTIGAGQVIKGWDNGIVGMRVGGKRTLILSAPQGYGVSGAGTSIPPNATLIFDVEMVTLAP